MARSRAWSPRRYVERCQVQGRGSNTPTGRKAWRIVVAPQDSSLAAPSTATAIADLGAWSWAALPASHSVFAVFCREVYAVEVRPRAAPATHRRSGTDNEDPSGEHTRDTTLQHTRRSNTMRARGRPGMYTRHPTSTTAHGPPQPNTTTGLRARSVSWGNRCSPTLHTFATGSNRNTHGVTATMRRPDVTTTRHGFPRHAQHLSRHPRGHRPRLNIAPTRGGERGRRRILGGGGAAGVAY